MASMACMYNESVCSPELIKSIDTKRVNFKMNGNNSNEFNLSFYNLIRNSILFIVK